MSFIQVGIQSKLFYYFLLIISVTLTCGGLVIEEILVRWRMESIQVDLARHLGAIELMVQEIPQPVLHDHVHQLAHKMGKVLEMRVTFIDSQGWVKGDSAVSGSPDTLENHAFRPEVVAAMSHSFGTSTRYSSTTSSDMFYMAHVIGQGSQKLIVRLARSLEDVQKEISSLRRLILLSVLVALFLAALMSGLAARLATKSLRTLVQQAMRITNGDRDERIIISSRDEIGGLAESFNSMLNHLEQMMATVSLERDRLKTVLEGILDGVIAVDSYGRITLANHAAMDLLGLKITPVSRYLEEVLPRDQMDGLLPPYCKEVFRGDIELHGRLERRLQVVASCTVSDGGCIFLLRDITEKHRLGQVQRDFVASASHELRTPVSIIRLNAETLMDGALEDQEMAHSLVDAILRQSLRLSQLVGDLLDLSRLESGSYHLNKTAVSANRVIQQVHDSLSQLMADKPIRFASEVDEDLMVYADASALEQVLTNLVSNAIKYTPPHGRVTVAARVGADHQVRFLVEDNGPGIPPEHHPLLFNRFYRVDPGRSREMGGTGLGLTIVKHLLEAMNGQIGLEDVDPHGCRFWFTLPVSFPRP